MALGALEHRNVTEIHWMFEWLVGLVTGLAFSAVEGAEIDGMLEACDLYRSCGILRVIDDCVTNIAVLANNFAAITDVLSVMTTKTTGRVKVADVIWVR